jgi:hypothetical protein
MEVTDHICDRFQEEEMEKEEEAEPILTQELEPTDSLAQE